MIPFAPWLPDVATFQTSATNNVLNVIPSETGFRPFAGFGNIASAITARAQGAFSVRGLAGAIHNFCGDTTKLYHLNSDGLVWTDISRTVGGVYGTPTDGWWDFALFGDKVIATNGFDALIELRIEAKEVGYMTCNDVAISLKYLPYAV